jgi:hypothetical protein
VSSGATCVSIACFRSQGIGPPNGLSGLFTGFSFYRFTSQPFLGSLPWIRVVDDSFPGGGPSRTTRDHFQVYGYNLPPLRGSIRLRFARYFGQLWSMVN